MHQYNLGKTPELLRPQTLPRNTHGADSPPQSKPPLPPKPARLYRKLKEISVEEQSDEDDSDEDEDDDEDDDMDGKAPLPSFGILILNKVDFCSPN